MSTTLADRRTDFAFRLLAELERRAAGAPVVCAPANIHDAAALICLGAAGATRAELADALALAGLSDDEIAYGLATLHRVRRELGAGVALVEATALFASPAFAIAPRFQALADAAAAVEMVYGPVTAAAINAWVSARTHGKIARVAETDDAVFSAVTALHFEGRWAEPFDPKQTKPQVFTRPDGETLCDMMWTTETWAPERRPRLVEDARCLGARFAYHGDRVAFYALKPRRGTTVATLCAALDGASFRALRGRFEDNTMPVGLPRLDLDLHTSLAPALEALGVRAAFDAARADLSALGRVATAPNLYLDEVCHAARLEVDEAGTVAAAATVMSTRAGGITYPLVFDRPFVAAIVDERSGDILVLGAISSPHNGACRPIPAPVLQYREAMRNFGMTRDDD